MLHLYQVVSWSVMMSPLRRLTLSGPQQYVIRWLYLSFGHSKYVFSELQRSHLSICMRRLSILGILMIIFSN